MESVKIQIVDEDILIYISGKDRKRMNEIKKELKRREEPTEIKEEVFEFNNDMINIIKSYIENGYIFNKKGLYFQVNVNNKNYRGIKRNMSGISQLLKNHGIDINIDYPRFKNFMLKDRPPTRENIKNYASLSKYKTLLQQYITELI